MLFLQTDEKNNIIKWPISEIEIRNLLPNISLPEDLTDIDLTKYYIHSVDIVRPPETTPDKRIQLDDPVYDKKHKKWVRQFKFVDRTEAEIETGWKRIRTVRDKRLSDTDWTQISDVSLSKLKKEEFKVYRQALRDITKTFDSPFKVIWPIKPE